MSKILIVDDDDQIRRFLERTLRSSAFEMYTAPTLGQGLERAEEEGVDLVFLDIALPDGNGLDYLERFQKTASSPEIIIITGHSNEQGAKYALEFGVFDYLQKPIAVDEIRLSTTRALEFRSFRTKQERVTPFQHEAIVGKEHRFKQCLKTAAQAAASETTVLITGETGTGKDLFARAIHDNSPRSQAGFILMDCASVKSSLLENVLFGHVKGAYTGAESSQEGQVALAHKGTLFLDEIGELDLEAQKRFLRLLEDKSFRPLGATQMKKSDFRLICATNRDLESDAEQGRFRHDLFFRISGLRIPLPPLRKRKKDLRELTQHLLEKACSRMHLPQKGIYPEVIEALALHDWPGNVRELKKALDEVLARYPEDANLQPRHLPTYLRIASRRQKDVEQDHPQEAFLQNEVSRHSILSNWKDHRKKALDSLEKNYFQALAAQSKGRVTDMARISGLTRVRIYELLKKHHLVHQTEHC